MTDRTSSATRLIEVFNGAQDLPAGEAREKYLEEACGADANLRAEVEQLLSADDEAKSYLNLQPPLSQEPVTTIGPLHPERTGERIGRYKLLQQIGEGGFGTVWMAEQVEPVLRRVALKIIKLGMDTEEFVARFEAERQALAMMDHPNIARVFDGGATDKGRPFFVMELVKGVPITQFCDERQLGTRERLALFGEVCSAINHAHQKGVIHRDIKPSNVMISLHGDKPVVKVIDFGIAKATEGRLTEKTLFTRFEQVIGTPVYMSPEQAASSGLDIDTRSDIYGLGVLLYELLTGKPPFDAKSLVAAGFDEMRRIIREVEPPKPSSRLSTIIGAERTSLARARHIEPDKLSRLVEPDLDWIVMKAIDKDRTRRYETANGLALDIQRFLADEPVSATPPSAGYRLRKFVWRNKVALGIAAGFAVVLMAAVVVSTWQAVVATREKKRSAEALNELRATAPAFAEQARSLAAAERFDEAIDKLDYAVKLRPDVAEYFVAKADLLQCQMKLAEAATIYHEALRLKPGMARAETSAKLCDELLAAKPGDEGKLSRESLAKLHMAMQQQQRPAAELMPVARLLGEEKKLIVEYWLERLKDLPVSAEKPLKDRLTMQDDGRLALDLSGTKVVDLSPLSGAPLAVLDVSNSKDLVDLSPLRGIALTWLRLGGTGVADLSSLRDMHSLEKLNVAFTKVSDLSPLSALRLTEIDLTGTRIFDISALRGMKLKKLDLRDTRVADLSPSAGMPLTFIDASNIPASDYAPLAGAPLEACTIQNSPVRDLSFLTNSPVKDLCLFGCNELRGYSVLAGLKQLELLILPQGFRTLPDEELAAIGALRTHPSLKNIQTEYRSSGGWIIPTTTSKDIFWQDWDREQSFVPALRKAGIVFTTSKLPAGTYRLSISKQPLTDLSILKGAPITELTLGDCPFTDLTPIRDLKLERLVLIGGAVADLNPLRGMPLRSLVLAGPKFSDLSALKGLPLRELYLEGCPNVRDVAVLAEIPTLENVILPIKAQNIEVLRRSEKLQRLAFQRNADGSKPATTAEVFWKENAPDGGITRLRNSNLDVKALKRLDDGTWEVNLAYTPITDLTILRGAPISNLQLGNTAVSDLSPLRGMPLKALHLYNTQVQDLSPLQGMALELLQISGTPVKDISVLRGMPLTYLRLHACHGLTDVSPLKESKNLETLTLPPKATDFEFLRDFAKLQRIAFHEDEKRGYRPNKTAAEFWTENDKQGWIAGLRKAGIFPKKLEPLSDGTWILDVADAKLSDLNLLKGAPISVLRCGNNPVVDLEPLRGMALTELKVFNTKVTDLTPLKGMPLQTLHLGGTRVSDLSALRGMPLTRLWLHHCENLTDLSPLKDVVTLTELTLPPRGKDLEILRALPKLERVGYAESNLAGLPDRTTEEFWKEWDANGWLKTLRAMEPPPKLQRHPNGIWWVRFDEGIGISDLSILSGMPIVELSLGDIKSSDLSPLQGMPLKHLNVYGSKIADVSPLAGMPLEHLTLAAGEATDISALRGMPLTTLRLRFCPKLRDISPLAGCKTLVNLTLPPNATNLEFLRAMPNLKRLGFEEDANRQPKQTTAEFWKEYDSRGWIAALRDSGIAVEETKRNSDGTWSVRCTDPKFHDVSVFRGAQISHLYLRGTAVADISALRGLPLTSLSLFQTNVVDLRPLEGLPLRYLDIRSTKVSNLASLSSPVLRESLRDLKIYNVKATDFSPVAQCQNLEILDASNCAIESLEIVRGRKLRGLRIAGTKVSDLSLIAGMPLEEIMFDDTPVTNLRPLLECPTLKKIVLPASASDVGSLRALPALAAISYEHLSDGTPKHTAAEFWTDYDAQGWLRALEAAGVKPVKAFRLPDGTWDVEFYGVPIADLALLRGAPISNLKLGNTAIKDLSPLRGMKLRRLFIFGTKVSDLGPLKEMPLTEFHAAGAPISDISAFRGMPLTGLRLHGCKNLTDLSPLADSNDLRELTIPPGARNFEFLRALPKLERLSYAETTSKGGPPSMTAEEFWKEYDALSWQRTLRESGITISKLAPLADGTWEVDIGRSKLSDLTMLKNARISSLNVAATDVSDLTPLRGMPLKELSLWSTKVTDLTPLQGMPLDWVNLNKTPVRDISPLRGRPLTRLGLQGCAEVTDLSPLADCKTLEILTLPPNVKNVEVLRQLPNLKYIGYNEIPPANRPDKTAEEFWTEYDAKKK
jgi:Leucine-rich repeat (LRR) protein